MRGFIRTTHGLSSCVCGGGGEIFAVQMKTQREESCAKKRERKRKRMHHECHPKQRDILSSI